MSAAGVWRQASPGAALASPAPRAHAREGLPILQRSPRLLAYRSLYQRYVAASVDRTAYDVRLRDCDCSRRPRNINAACAFNGLAMMEPDMAKESRSASKDVKSAMHQRKAGALKSGGSGKTVKSKKQAIRPAARCLRPQATARWRGGRKSALPAPVPQRRKPGVHYQSVWWAS